MDLLSLPPELLHLIASFIPSSSLPAVALTCHHLRAIALPPLLSHLRIYTPVSYFSVLLCVLRHAPLRRHVAALEVSCGYRGGIGAIALLREVRHLWRGGWMRTIAAALADATDQDRQVVKFVFGDDNEEMWEGRPRYGQSQPQSPDPATPEASDAVVYGVSPGKIIASLVLLCTQASPTNTLQSLSVEFPQMTPLEWQPVYELNAILSRCGPNTPNTPTTLPLPRISRVAITRVQNRANCIIPSTCPILLQLPGITTISASYVNLSSAILDAYRHHHRHLTQDGMTTLEAYTPASKKVLVLPPSLKNLHLIECATPAYALQDVLAHGTQTPLETLVLSRCQARFFQEPWYHRPRGHNPPPPQPNPHMPNTTPPPTPGPLDLGIALSKHAPSLKSLDLDMYLPVWEGELAYAPDWRTMALAVNLPPVLSLMDNLTRLRVEFAVLWGSVAEMRAWGTYHSASVILPRTLRTLDLTERWYAHQRLYGLYYESLPSPPRSPISLPLPTPAPDDSITAGCTSVLDYRSVVLAMIARMRAELANARVMLALDASMWVRDGDRILKEVVRIDGAEVRWRVDRGGD